MIAAVIGTEHLASKENPLRAFRLLWAGQTVSVLGDQVTLLALPMTALALGASVTDIAMLATIMRTPFLILGLPAGAWVARIGLRRAMVIADVLRFLSLLSIPITAATRTLSFPYLLVVAVVLGLGTMLFQIAYQSVTPLLVPARLLRSANAKLTIGETAAQMSGPALGGVLIGMVGAAWALLVDTGSYAVSVATLTALGPIGEREQGKRRSVASEVSAGLRYVLQEPSLRALLWSSVLFNTGMAGYEALLAVFAISHLGISSAALGFAVGVGGVGIPVGLLASGWIERRFGVGVVLVISAALSAAGFFVTGLAQGPGSTVAITAGTFITAVGGGAWGVTALTARQTLSTSKQRAMTTAVYRWATYGVLPLGAFLAGEMADLFGVRAAVLLTAAIAQTCVLPLLFSPLRSRRSMSSRSISSGAADSVGNLSVMHTDMSRC